MSKSITMGVWALQGVMAFVVLAISIDIINKQNDPHTTFKYNAFTGGLGILVVALGLASSFFDAIPSLVVMAADAVSGVLLLGGGIHKHMFFCVLTAKELHRYNPPQFKMAPVSLEQDVKYLPLSLVCAHAATVAYLGLTVARSLHKSYRDLPPSQGTRARLVRRSRLAPVFAVLASVSLAVAGYWTLSYAKLSYRVWADQRSVDAPVRFYGDNGVLPFGENATRLHVTRWLSDTPVYLDALEIITEKARRFWWGQQVDLAITSWSLLLAVEGRRRRIPSLWAYLALAHLVNLSFAQNVFYLTLLLAPVPMPGLPSASMLGRLRNRAFPPKPVGWVPHPAFFLASYCLNQVLIYWAPATVGTSTFASVAILSRILTFAPVILPAVVPASWGTVYSDHHGAYSIVTDLFRLVSSVSFVFHLKGTALGLLYNAPDAHYHRHSRFLPFDRERRSAWERTTTALGKVLGSASDHPVVASVAWDVVLSGISQGLWAATRALDVNDILASSTPFFRAHAEKAQPPTRLSEGSEILTPDSETGSHGGAVSTRRKGRSSKSEFDSMTISKGPTSHANRRDRTQKEPLELEAAPEVPYEPTTAERRSAVEGDELPGGDMDWESAALVWGLAALGGLGSSSAGVFGAECTSH
ncbi:hypothetical protein CTRI78_v007709 [Colletotrichum trifolii]|uniref:Uncharacterized protein n=1 Tax=Colletotrichum trifolii TaxID=5466 RepID=A0A4R8R1Z3_COLTR|nr:hypothetical protein CTRI78_v007709 [Colletotrichum trifolii]